MIKSRKMIRAGHVARMRKNRNIYQVFVGKLESERPLGNPRRRLEDNIKMDLREMRWGHMDLIDLAQDRDKWISLVNMVMNRRVP
jgi:hypothetical protein